MTIGEAFPPSQATAPLPVEKYFLCKLLDQIYPLAIFYSSEYVVSQILG